MPKEKERSTMGSNLDRQLEKEIESFLKENWKIVLPVGGVIGGVYFGKKHITHLQVIMDTVLPYIQTGAITIGSVGGFFLTFLAIRAYIIRKKEKEHYRYFRIIPRAKQPVNASDVHEMVHQFATIKRGKKKRLLKGREWFQWLIHHDIKEGYAFYIGFPKDQQHQVLQTLKNAYPEAELHQVDVPFPSTRAFSGRMRVKKHPIKQWMPFKTYKSGDQVGNLLSYMPTNSWLALAFTAETRKKMGKKLFKAEKQLKDDKKLSQMYSFEREQFRDITSRLTGNNKAFKVSIALAGEGNHRKDIVKSIAKNVGSVLNNKNFLYFRRHRRALQVCPHPRAHLLYLTNLELANLLHLPDMNHSIAQTNFPTLEKGQRHLATNELHEGATVGYNLHPLIKDRKVSISFSQLTEMFFLSGQTGSGKSSLLIMMLQSIIDKWLEKPNATPGFTFLDPAGTTARTILNRLMKAELEGKHVPWEKVVYVSFKNGDAPIGLNFFHKNPWEDTDTVVQNAMSLFKTIYTGDKTRIDKYLSNTITALIDDVEKHNVLGINRFLTDKKFRTTIVNRIQDDLLRDFWLKVDEKEVKQVAADVYSRINSFEQSLFMRRMFGQTNWDLPIKKYMDEGYIVLLDIAGMGRINTKLIVGHIVNQYHQICQKRKPYSSKEHFLIKDEAHLVQIPVLEKIIAEDRKFGLCLGLSTQYLGQFEDWLQRAIDGNVQNIMSGAQGGTEAKIMADVLMKKQFDADLIATLPNNNAAILTKNSDKTLTTCLVKSALPYLYKPDGSIAKHKDDRDTTIVENWIDEKATELQAHIGRNVEEIDQGIRDYYGFRDEETEEEETTNEFFEEKQPMEESSDVETIENKENEPSQIPTESSPSGVDSVIIEEESSVSEEKEKKSEKDNTEGADNETKESFF